MLQDNKGGNKLRQKRWLSGNYSSIKQVSVRNKPSQKCVPISDMDENGTQSAPYSYLHEARESLRGGESSPLRMRLQSFRGYGQRDREKENYTIKKIWPVALVTEKDSGQHFVVLVILT